MHVLNSAHIIAAIGCALAAWIVIAGLFAIATEIVTRRNERAQIDNTTFESSPYAREYDHDDI